MKENNAPIWAREGHLQTIFGYFLRYVPEPRGGRAVTIALPDGDALAAKAYAGSSDTAVVLFHGLAGSTASTYIRRAARDAIRAGHSVLVVNHRGCGEGRALTFKGLYHSGSAEDLGAAIKRARTEFCADKKVVAIGYSLSANALLLLLGKNLDGLPDAAIAVNPPIHLESTAKNLTRGINRVYDRKFLIQCVSDIREREKRGWVRDLPDLDSIRTLYEFDAAVTAKLAGFGTRENYYSTCSAAGVLKDIRVPTRILTAKDDPFVDYSHFVNAELSDSVEIEIAERGGHLGYLSRGKLPLTADFWMDRTVSRWTEDLRKSLGKSAAIREN